MNLKKMLVSLLALSLAAGPLAGCSSTGGASSAPASSQAPASSAAPSSSAAPASSAPAPAESTGLSYPIEGNPHLTYWVELNSNVSAGSSSMNETPIAAAVNEATGIDVEYIHPAQGAAKEAFNLLIASNDLPDIIEYYWLSNYPGGPELAFKNKILEPLNEHLADWAPDYAAFLEKNPDLAKMVRTDAGNYFAFPFIRGADDLMVFVGPIVRKDWLEELKIEAPTTISEWHDMLAAFKEQKGAAAPLTTGDKDLGLFNFGFLCSAWGVTTGYSLNEAGEVIYGPTQPGFKEFLSEMNRWYAEGLLDVNFYANDRNALQSNLFNNISGATLAYAGSGLGVFEKSIKELDASAGFEGLVYPTLNKGETAKIGQRDFAFMNSYTVAAVTASSQNKQAAYAFLNFGFTEQGEMLYNFGIEGESYNMENGYPKYTAMITDPGEGKTMAQMMGQYMRSNYGGPFVQRLEYYEQYMQMDVQKDAVTNWKQTDAEKYQVPPVTPTQEESKEYNTIAQNMETWRNEWAIGAITGQNPIDEFETRFIPEMESIGLARALEIQNGALERYNNR